MAGDNIVHKVLKGLTGGGGGEGCQSVTEK